MPQDLDDLQHATAPATWSGTIGAPPAPDTVVVGLVIGVPSYASVRTLANRVNGEKRVELEDITLADLITLRDSINTQIDQVTEAALEQDLWEPLG